MTDKPFDEYFSEAVSGRRTSYVEARDAILALYAEGQSEIPGRLTTMSADPTDWNKQLTAQIVHGWIGSPAVFETCTQLMQGNLPGPSPLPGFTAAHRAAAP